MRPVAPDSLGAAVPAPSRVKAKGTARRAGAIELPVLLAVASAALVWGWQQRGDGDLTAENGAGYVLGIVGGAMMLALLLYPLRKRLSALRVIGGVRAWFRVHMIFGVAGPVLVILHSNFSLGSLNSTIALAAMLTVAVSGLAGRFLYSRIHRGLYGRRAHVREFLGEIDGSKSALMVEIGDAPDLVALLKEYESRRLSPSPSLRAAMGNVLSSPFAQLRLSRRARHLAWLSRQGAQNRGMRGFRRQLNTYLRSVARAEAFTMYERLFALWHLLHLPLFLILVFAAFAHVIAVHMY